MESNMPEFELNGSMDPLQHVDWFHFRSLFYLVSPSEFGHLNDSKISFSEAPDYYAQAIPAFLVLTVLECIATYLITGKGFRLNDSIASFSAGMLAHMTKLCIKGFEAAVYIWLFNNYRLFTIYLATWPQWIAAFLLTDFCYYWFHRASHEINFLWAAHQVHHSSDEFNFTVAVRQSVVSHFVAWIFYLPMAVVGFSPVTFVVHYQLNLLYQFWVHSSLIKSLGPFELVLNTPSHHRAHHGRNPQYIDINYGGVLIIWDRLFGTFIPESSKEPCFYGIVAGLNSFNPVWAQLVRFDTIRQRMISNQSVSDKLSAAFKGPRWRPGLPFFGLLNRNISIYEKEKNPERNYDPQISVFMKVYATVHFLAILPWFLGMHFEIDDWSWIETVLTIGHLTASLAVIGSVFDGREGVPYAEIVRCFLLSALCMELPGLDVFYFETQLVFVLRVLYTVSTVFWGSILLGFGGVSAVEEKTD